MRTRLALLCVTLLLLVVAAELLLPLFPPRLGTMQRIVYNVDSEGHYALRPETEISFHGMFENLSQPVGDSLGRLHFDTVLFDGAALEFLVKTWGADHVLMGTDYPFLMHDPRPVETVNALPGVSEEDLGLIRGGNAARLLRMGALACRPNCG